MFSFIESPLFTKLVQDYLGDDEYGKLQQALVEDPEAGSVIRGSGGVRKLRWAAASGADTESSITSRDSKALFGCLPCTRRASRIRFLTTC